MTKHIFVTGGTGFLGRETLKNLTQTNTKIYLLVRAGSKSKLKGLKKRNFEIVYGDITRVGLGLTDDETQVIRKRVTHIVHCAGLRDPNTISSRVYLINTQGTKNVLDFAKKLKKLEVFIHISSKSVSGNYEGIFPEQSLPVVSSFHSDYEKSKYQAEALVRRSKVPFIIIRPPTILGNSKTGQVDAFDGSVYKIISALNKGRLPFYPSRCDGLLYVMPVDTVGKFTAKVALNPLLLGYTFNLSLSSLVTFRQFIGKTSRLLGVHGPVFTLPGFIWNTFLKVTTNFGFFNTGSLSLFNQKLFFENKAFKSAAKKHRIVIPELDSYLPVIIDYFEKIND